ncbi:MAG: hypothetical protein M1820_001926 [Bogoriella megaspora]|nr:MAG: hypothetical protein M1820_001926 [Bogoriella megaspora]
MAKRSHEPFNNQQPLHESISFIWTRLGLPNEALEPLHLPGSGLILPSSFKIADLAQSTIALSALSAALIHSLATNSTIPTVTVPRRHAALEFMSERLYTLNGKTDTDLWGPIGGLHGTSDGYVRIHDSFPHHRHGALELLGLSADASREDVAKKVLQWNAQELENAAVERGLVIAKLRSYKEWDEHPQSKALPDFPIEIRKVGDSLPGLSTKLVDEAKKGGTKCLKGLRVLELSRVIAAPVAGKTLAAHGADVLWVTSAKLPSLPRLDADLSRGKRSIQLDLDEPGEKMKLLDLVRDADVVIQSYRPGSLAARGLGAADLAKINPNLVYANLSAYGHDGPWAKRRGFDSLVQTCTGFNVSEAEHWNLGTDGVEDRVAAKALPCQALDHAAGYLLATVILAALYRRAKEGGSWEVTVSLAGVGKYLRSLGQHEGDTGFACQGPKGPEDVEEYLEERDCDFGKLKALRHAANLESLQVGWDEMPRISGSSEMNWL